MLVLSLCMIFVVIPAETQDGVWYGLSPYFFPTLLMSGVALTSVLLIIQAARGRAGEAEATGPLSWRQFMMFALAAAIVISGVVAIDLFGIWIGGPALIASLMLFMGERRPIRIIVTSVAPVAIVHVIALYVLRSPLP